MLVSCHTFLSNIYHEIETAIDITVNINIKIKIDICLRINNLQKNLQPYRSESVNFYCKLEDWTPYNTILYWRESPNRLQIQQNCYN